MTEPRYRILALAYACEPSKGSEPGAGWAWVQLLARFADVTVVTRENNRAAIEDAAAALPNAPALQFAYVDLPSWARWWKRGQGGVRLYYLLWQVAAVGRARRLHREQPFDLVWHLTLANAWLGSLGPLVGPPFVYGPVGGGIAFPWRFVRAVGVRGTLYEVARGAARLLGRRANPLARLAWTRARVIVAQNEEMRAWLPASTTHRVVVLPHAFAEDGLQRTPRERGRVALLSARLIPWKGGALALEAMARAPGWRLVVCGSGPDEKRLRRIAERLGVASRVEFRGRVARAEVERILRDEADVLLHPALHDDAPLGVAEAIAAGVPVLCLARGGAAVLAPENAVPLTGGLAGTVAALADALVHPERWATTPPQGIPIGQALVIAARALSTTPTGATLAAESTSERAG